MALVYIVLYLIFLIVVYFFVLKRIKVLSKWHFEDIGIVYLKDGYKIIRTRMIILFTILFILCSLLILTFTGNVIYSQWWVYNNQETLVSDGF
jgi:hypothetical protein